MIRKTMRVGEIRTSIKLEPEFWDYLKEVADTRSIRLSALVNEVARASPERTNLASTLRTFALIHARLRCNKLSQDLDALTLAGNTRDLMRVIAAFPLPVLVLNGDREIRQLNRAFALWLNIDEKATIGHRLDHIMILRGANMRELWAAMLDGRVGRVAFNATYVSPGKVRTAQALALPLAIEHEERSARSCVVVFETLAGRT